MKLNCGPTRLEKFHANHEWHRFFCLFPRRLTSTHECRWLETIERKGDFTCNYGGGGWDWTYRAIQK